MALNITWFVLFFVLIGGYAAMDGFSLGVGVLNLFTRDKQERRINMNAIGPVWDGNEVWLLAGGGALFAAFPVVYATVFSGLYLALMLVLFALIFRAVSLEFSNKVESPLWRGFWNMSFGVASLLPSLLYGVAWGNILRGLPLDGQHNFTGTFLGLLNPYSLAVGVLSLVLFTMHGAAWMCMKSDGPQQERMQKWLIRCWIATVVLFVGITIATIFSNRYLFPAILKNPLCWVFLVLLAGALVYIPMANKAGQHLRSFLASAVGILSLVGLSAVSLFPRLVPARPDLANSLTLSNASSTPLTLKTMLIIAIIGMPIVIGYTAAMYYIFRGKVKLEKESY